MRHSNRPLMPCLFLCLVLMVTACGAPETDGEAPASSLSESGEGTAEFPSGFPEDFPFPDEFEIEEATFTEGDAFTQANYLVRGTSPMSVSGLAEFYLSRLPEAGYDKARLPLPAPPTWCCPSGTRPSRTDPSSSARWARRRPS